MKNKIFKILPFIAFMVAFLLLFPRVYHLKDGGTVEYRAVLYQVVRYHSLNLLLDDGYDDGIQINILGFQVYRRLDSDDPKNFISKDETNEQIVQVNGDLYYNTKKESTISLRCGTMDGYITSHVEVGKIPTVDNQSNFEGDFGYQYSTENTIEVKIGDQWIIFEKKNATFTRTYTVEHIKSGEEQGSYYVTLSIFQGETDTVFIRSLSKKLEVGKTYEFTFWRDRSTQIEDTVDSIFENCTIQTIEETTKVGLNQVQQSVF